MKAMVYHTYGSPDVLHLEEVPKPTPQANEVLLKIHTASLNAYDWHLLRADPFLARLERGLFRPKITILGADVAGQVEAVGSNVTQFQPGDEVFGDLSLHGDGGFAEYVAVPETSFVSKPANMTFAEAASIPMAAVTALQGLRDVGKIRAGQKVLINGASGGVGTFAVQIAKTFDAEVTAVCSTRKMEMTRALGADHIIDYTQEDFTQGKERYDLILAVNGFYSLAAYKRVLNANGIYAMVGGTNAQIFQALFLSALMSMTGDKKMGTVMAKPNQKDLTFITELFESGKVKPVIDRHYPLAELPDAIRYLEEGHAKGKVLIDIA